MKFASIIMTHWSESEERSRIMRESIVSLIENTDYPYELIVVNNGNVFNDHLFLSSLKRINTYILNRENMSFGYSRNQGLDNAHGDYIVIIDNDIKLEKGWLTRCVEALDNFPDEKIYSTPLSYPMSGMNKYYHKGFLKKGENEYELNMRAGSNCFCVRRDDMREIGDFKIHRIAGSHWTNSATRKGYLACVLPGNYATDLGLRKGYMHKQSPPIKIKLSNNDELYFNKDEFRKENPGLNYYDKTSIR